MVSGLVFDIKKFAIHDGPGIRTTVFVKGCPLRCLWCHNPESQRFEPEISFMPDKCIGCGWCFEVCPEQCHGMDEGRHVFRRERCTRCGKCTERCYAQALEMVGKEMTTGEALAEVLKDKPFYQHSNGGMTISGGEPMSQFAFTRELLQMAKQEGLHNCLDTCGFAPYERYRELLPYVDIFLYDLKASDPEKHLKLTGVPLEPILENLDRLDRDGASIILRCPLIPGTNDDDEHLRRIGEIASRHANITEVTLHPYHPLGQSKIDRMGYEAGWQDNGFASDEAVGHWLETVSRFSDKPVKKA